MIDKCIQVTAPARLHFGLLSFGNRQRRRFGGMGLMVQRPAVKLRCVPARRFQVTGPLADRVSRVAAAWSRWQSRDGLPACRVEVCASPQPHTGLGTGTQLGLAVAAGLNALLLPTATSVSPAELAAAAGRGHRSAVGTYGFHFGGLIVESGKVPGDTIGPLENRVAVPSPWRFVLLRPRNHRGMSGTAEQAVFARLDPVPASTTRRLGHLAREVILPAARANRFEQFAEGIYDYGYLAGTCFASIQGGPFAGPRLTELVETVRSIGVRGAGQSSWGPTVFAALPDESAARWLVDWISRHYAQQELSVVLTGPNNSGAQVTAVCGACPHRRGRP
jgi:beta-RFAP synthase